MPPHPLASGANNEANSLNITGHSLVLKVLGYIAGSSLHYHLAVTTGPLSKALNLLSLTFTALSRRPDPKRPTITTRRRSERSRGERYALRGPDSGPTFGGHRRVSGYYLQDLISGPQGEGQAVNTCSGTSLMLGEPFPGGRGGFTCSNIGVFQRRVLGLMNPLAVTLEEDLQGGMGAAPELDGIALHDVGVVRLL